MPREGIATAGVHGLCDCNLLGSKALDLAIGFDDDEGLYAASVLELPGGVAEAPRASAWKAPSTWSPSRLAVSGCGPVRLGWR